MSYQNIRAKEDMAEKRRGIAAVWPWARRIASSIALVAVVTEPAPRLTAGAISGTLDDVVLAMLSNLVLLSDFISEDLF